MSPQQRISPALPDTFPPVSRWKPTLSFGLLCLLLAGIGWFYAQLPDPEVVGFVQDDGVYAITGKALALGEGFRLLQVVSSPMQVKYPILYPFLLSIGWQLQPDFPQNLPLLYGITIGCFLLALGALFYYFHLARKVPTWVCFLFILLLAANSQMMQYTTMLMSEAPYLLFCTLALLYAETQLNPPTSRRLGIAMLLCALAFHSRVLGFLLVLAITAKLLFQKQYQKALTFLGGSSLLTIVPWAIWAFFHQPATPDPITKTYGKYGVDFWIHSQSAYGAKLIQSLSNFIYGLLSFLFPGLAHFLEIPELKPVLAGHPLVFLLVSLFITLCVYGLAGYFLLRIIQGLRACFAQAASHHFDIAAWYVSLYCLLIIGWNFEFQISRFLVVILPWLWFYLLEPFIKRVNRPQRNAALATLGLLLVCCLALAATPRLYTTMRYTRLAHQWINLKKSPQYVNLWDDYRDTFRYIQTHLPPKASIAAGLYNGALYLYTGHQTYPINLAALDRSIGLQASSQHLWKDLQRHHVNYLLVEPEIGGDSEVSYPSNMMAQALLEFYPKQFKEQYSAPGGMLTLYQIIRP